MELTEDAVEEEKEETVTELTQQTPIREVAQDEIEEVKGVKDEKPIEVEEEFDWEKLDVW